MLPIRDRNPAPIAPYVVYVLIALNLFAFFIELGQSPEELGEFVERFGVVPFRVTAALRGEGSLLLAILIPTFTSMFLHGGWAHLLGNMWYLWIFGDNVEGRLGHVKFALFYLICGLAAAMTHYVLSPGSKLPTIGASGAIAGVLGAYAVCWPRARILTIVPIFYFIHFVELPALLVLGFWFLIQFVQGAASLGVAFDHGGVAYWAHVGGFVAGVLLIKLLPGQRYKRRREQQWDIGRGPRNYWY